MKIFLRNLKDSDINILLETENDESLWNYSLQDKPFSKSTIKNYIKNASVQDIIEAKQKRFVISSNKIAKNLDIKLKDLRSRLIGFVGLEVPEVPEEDKIKALLESAERKGIVLEEKTLKYILTYTSRNLSDLLRLLSELDEFSLEKKKKLSPSLVRELLSQKSNSLHI